MLLQNLKQLKDDMKLKDWSICSFIFNYKNVEYVVLVKRFVGKEIRCDKYAMVRLHFLESKDLTNDLEVEANSAGIIVNTKTLREYFGIEYNPNLGNILKQFTELLGKCIPLKIPVNISNIEKTAMISSLSKSDSENPNKIYCGKVRRNPIGNKRSEYNSDKTKLLRPSLFKYFENDTSISFCYYVDLEKENDDSIIIRRFSK